MTIDFRRSIRACSLPVPPLLALGSTLMLSAGAANPVRVLNYDLADRGGVYGISVDEKSTAWVTRPGANRIDRIAVTTNQFRREQVVTKFPLPPITFQSPASIATESPGRIWFTDSTTRRIGTIVLDSSGNVERIDRDDEAMRDAVPAGLIPGTIEYIPGVGIVCALNSDGTVPSQILIFQPDNEGRIPAEPGRIALGQNTHVLAFAYEPALPSTTGTQAASSPRRLFFVTDAHSIGWIDPSEPAPTVGTLSLNIQDLFEPSSLTFGPKLASSTNAAATALWVTAGQHLGVLEVFPAKTALKPRVVAVRRLPFPAGPIASTGTGETDVVLIGSASPANAVLRLTAKFKRHIFRGRGRSPITDLAADPKKDGVLWFTQPFVERVGRLVPPIQD